jgi:hypothetical protein
MGRRVEVDLEILFLQHPLIRGSKRGRPAI